MALGVEGHDRLLDAALEENTTASAKGVSDHVRALGVAAQDELGVGALLVVGDDLGDGVGAALVDRVAVGVGQHVLHHDVLVVAAVVDLADGVDQLALPARVRLVVALGQEDVHVGALARPRRLPGV